MKNILVRSLAIVFVTMAFLASFAVAQDVDNIKFPKLNKLKVPKVEQITLDNGMRLYLLEDHSLPIFHASARINCGGYLDPEDKIGLASICGEVMRTGGTKKWTGDELDELLEGIGGSVETSIGKTSGSAGANILSEYTALAIEVLSQVLRNPVFDEDKIDLAKVGQRSGISRRNDDPQQIVFREFVKAIYGPASVYARHTEYATIEAITRDDLVNFHDNYFNPQNVQLAVWGDFKKKDVLKLIKKYFGDWKYAGDPVPPLPAVKYDFDQKIYLADKDDVNQTNIVMGHVGGLLTDEDYPARIVMNNILGGSFASRLFSNVRSKEGLAYAVFGVYTANATYPGIFYNFVSTKSETTAKAIREVRKQIVSMQTDPPTDDEMRMGKDGYLNSFVFKFDTKGEVVNRMMNNDFYGLPDDFLFKIKERVEAVSAEDVIEAAKKNLHPNKLRMIVVGNSADFEVPLDSLDLGEVANLDISIPSGEPETAFSITPENIQKGMELVERAIEVSGGKENYRKIASTSSKGTYTINTPNGEFAIAFESVDVMPGQSMNMFTVMGREMYDVRNGDIGWETDQATGDIVQKSSDALAKSDKELARNSLRLFKEVDNPYYQAIYDGSGEIDDQTIEFVAILDKDGESMCRLGFATETGLLICKSFWGESPMGEGEILEIYSDFSEISGVQIPMKKIRQMNKQDIGRIEYSKFEINGEIPPGVFDKPE